jgi:hypothetical protein
VREIDHDKYLREMRLRIRRVYSEKGKRGRLRISPGEDLRVIVDRHRRTLKVIPSDIELWLALFDEVAGFWFAVWAIYREQVEGPLDKRVICLMVLSGRVLQDILCVRELIVQGFFAQSNVVARSLIEAIDVMHLLNSRVELVTDFEQTRENVESSKFWHKYCSRGKINKIVKERWCWFFNGDEELASSFHSMREEYLDLVGMSTHPSFGASFAALMDSSEKEPLSIAHNAMGSISHMSKFTIHLILLRVFEYGLLWSGPEIALYKSSQGTKRKPMLHDHISKGLSVLLSMVKMLGEKPNGDPFYPDFQTYWPRENFER